MTESDRPKFAAVLKVLGDVFDKEIGPGLARAYFEALREHSIEQIERAATTCVRTSRFFPKPAELVEAIIGDPDDRATVVAMGGWQDMWRLDRLDAKELGFKRAEFVRLYGALLKRPPTEAPAKLIGQAEASNAARGFLNHDPVIAIGDGGTPERAALGNGQAALPEVSSRG